MAHTQSVVSKTCDNQASHQFRSPSIQAWLLMSTTASGKIFQVQVIQSHLVALRSFVTYESQPAGTRSNLHGQVSTSLAGAKAKFSSSDACLSCPWITIPGGKCMWATKTPLFMPVSLYWLVNGYPVKYGFLDSLKESPIPGGLLNSPRTTNQQRWFWMVHVPSAHVLDALPYPNCARGTFFRAWAGVILDDDFKVTLAIVTKSRPTGIPLPESWLWPAAFLG